MLQADALHVIHEEIVSSCVTVPGHQEMSSQSVRQQQKLNAAFIYGALHHGNQHAN